MAQPHGRAELLRYGLDWLLAAAILMAMALVLDRFGRSLPPGLATVLPPMFASVRAGMRFVRSEKRPLAGREAWLASLAMTGVVAVLTLLQLLLFWNSAMIAEAREVIPGSFLALIALVLLGVVLLVNRLFLGHGIKLGLKRLEE